MEIQTQTTEKKHHLQENKFKKLQLYILYQSRMGEKWKMKEAYTVKETSLPDAI